MANAYCCAPGARVTICGAPASSVDFLAWPASGCSRAATSSKVVAILAAAVMAMLNFLVSANVWVRQGRLSCDRRQDGKRRFGHAQRKGPAFAVSCSCRRIVVFPIHPCTLLFLLWGDYRSRIPLCKISGFIYFTILKIV